MPNKQRSITLVRALPGWTAASLLSTFKIRCSLSLGRPGHLVQHSVVSKRANTRATSHRHSIVFLCAERDRTNISPTHRLKTLNLGDMSQLLRSPQNLAHIRGRLKFHRNSRALQQVRYRNLTNRVADDFSDEAAFVVRKKPWSPRPRLTVLYGKPFNFVMWKLR